MRSVNIAELKNRLSAYLNEVREGREILVRDRNRPIARIVPWSAANLDEELGTLVTAGLLRPPEGRLPNSFWSMPAPRVSMKRIVAVVVADREER